MKSISAELQSHLAGEVTTLCTCWKVVRMDGVTFTFTDHDVDVVSDGVTYAGSTGYQRTAINADAALTVDNLELQGIFESDAITVDDLRSGKFDFAEVWIFVLNWSDPTQGVLRLRRGNLGEVTSHASGLFVAEFRGLVQRLSNRIGQIYMPLCRVDLGSPKCGVPIGAPPWLISDTVVGVVSQNEFTINTVATDNWFAKGAVLWTGGANAGRSMDIKIFGSFNVGDVVLALPMPEPIVPGDTLQLYPGCDKSPQMCFNKFNNIVNFRGEPFVPGQDAIMAYPDAVG